MRSTAASSTLQLAEAFQRETRKRSQAKDVLLDERPFVCNCLQMSQAVAMGFQGGIGFLGPFLGEAAPTTRGPRIRRPGRHRASASKRHAVTPSRMHGGRGQANQRRSRKVANVPLFNRVLTVSKEVSLGTGGAGGM